MLCYVIKKLTENNWHRFPYQFLQRALSVGNVAEEVSSVSKNTHVDFCPHFR